MKKLLLSLILVAGIGAQPGSAHHGTAVVYDLTGPPMTIEGRVTAIVWRNPHVLISVDVRDETAKIVNWTLEHNNVHTLAQQGYNANTLQLGQQVTAVIHGSRSGAPKGLTVKIILANGKEILQRETARQTPLP